MEQRLPDVGARLRGAREQRGLTLQEIANATKISLTALTAIERNDIARLPGGLYTRGHIRAYAAAVGLNPEESTSEYLAQFETPPAEEPAVSRGIDLDRRPSRVRLVAVLVLGVGLLAYGLFFWKSAEAPPATPVANAVSTEGGSDVPGNGAAVATGVGPALRLEIQVRSACWVSVRADGRVAVYKLMQRGERALVEAHDTLVLNIGNAGAFAYRINGAPGRPLGRPGDVVTIRITEDNYKTFLADAAG